MIMKSSFSVSIICTTDSVSRSRTTYLVELNDVGVANFFENFDFASDPLHVLLVIDFFFLKNFYSHLQDN